MSPTISGFSFAAQAPATLPAPARFVRGGRTSPVTRRGRVILSVLKAPERGSALAFLDEEEPLAASGGGGRPPGACPIGSGRSSLRRAIGIGVLVVILILIILGIKGA